MSDVDRGTHCGRAAPRRRAPARTRRTRTCRSAPPRSSTTAASSPAATSRTRRSDSRCAPSADSCPRCTRRAAAGSSRSRASTARRATRSRRAVAAASCCGKRAARRCRSTPKPARSRMASLLPGAFGPDDLPYARRCNVVDVIRTKRDGGTLTDEQIDWFLQRVHRGRSRRRAGLRAADGDLLPRLRRRASSRRGPRR